MSQSGDRMIKFEEDNWNDLAEKFIKKYESQWIDFVDDQYQQYITNQEPPDHYGEDR